MDKPILVTGCARSGTSLVAGIIDKCGAFGGETTPPLPHNPKGQFENDTLRGLLKEWISLQGYDKMGQKPLPVTNKLESWPVFKSHIEYVFKEQGYEGGPWYYKEAKLCLVWPMLHKNFPNAKWVFVRRPCESIVKSCLKTSFMRKRNSWKEWVEWVSHHLKCLDEMKGAGLDVTEIWSNKIVKGDFSEIKPFINRSGLKWDEDIVKDFVEPKYYGRND